MAFKLKHCKQRTDFYRTEEWHLFREEVLRERYPNAQIICEYCNKPIFRRGDCALHHLIELDELNYLNPDVSFNKELIQVLHRACHNEVHGRDWGHAQKVSLVFGPPNSGKSSFVAEVANFDDLVVDLDKIANAITNGSSVSHGGNRTKIARLRVRDVLLEMARLRIGDWRNAWIISAEPLRSARDRLAERVNADEIINFDCSLDECLERESGRSHSTNQPMRLDYINRWFAERT